MNGSSATHHARRQAAWTGLAVGLAVGLLGAGCASSPRGAYSDSIPNGCARLTVQNLAPFPCDVSIRPKSESAGVAAEDHGAVARLMPDEYFQWDLPVGVYSLTAVGKSPSNAFTLTYKAESGVARKWPLQPYTYNSGSSGPPSPAPGR